MATARKGCCAAALAPTWSVQLPGASFPVTLSTLGSSGAAGVPLVLAYVVPSGALTIWSRSAPPCHATRVVSPTAPGCTGTWKEVASVGGETNAHAGVPGTGHAPAGAVTLPLKRNSLGMRGTGAGA